MDALKQVELEMLKEFCSICDKYNLQYYLVGGTLLGAIRHQGFIPWDDDIDVAMPRSDYEIFNQIAQDNLPDGLFLQNHNTDPNYLLCFAKLRNSNTTFIESSIKSLKINHGVYIDIFPLDYYPEKNVWLFKIKNELYRARISAAFDTIPTKKMKVFQVLSGIIVSSSREATLRRDALMKKPRKSQTLANICGAWGKKEIMPEEWFGEGTEVTFEGLKARAPKEYDKYLTRVYGDYMTPPPLEKRVGHHYTEVIDLEKPYTEYVSKT